MAVNTTNREFSRHEAYVTSRALRYEIARLQVELVSAENTGKYTGVLAAELADAEAALAIFD